MLTKLNSKKVCNHNSKRKAWYNSLKQKLYSVSKSISIIILYFLQGSTDSNSADTCKVRIDWHYVLYSSYYSVNILEHWKTPRLS